VLDIASGQTRSVRKRRKRVRADAENQTRRIVSEATWAARSAEGCPARRQVSSATFSVQRDVQCPVRRQVSSATPNVQRDVQCPARRQVSGATFSVRRDAECQARHRVSDTMTLNYTMSSTMLTRHITYIALRQTFACNSLNDNENCAADCDDIRSLLPPTKDAIRPSDSHHDAVAYHRRSSTTSKVKLATCIQQRRERMYMVCAVAACGAV
jgi:hypothetical protein